VCCFFPPLLFRPTLSRSLSEPFISPHVVSILSTSFPTSRFCAVFPIRFPNRNVFFLTPAPTLRKPVIPHDCILVVFFFSHPAGHRAPSLVVQPFFETFWLLGHAPAFFFHQFSNFYFPPVLPTCPLSFPACSMAFFRFDNVISCFFLDILLSHSISSLLILF